MIYLVIPPSPLSLTDNSSECVREVLEEKILLLHVHAQYPVEELAHLIVPLVKSEYPWTVLARGYQTNTY